MVVFDGEEVLLLHRNDRGEWEDDDGKLYQVSAAAPPEDPPPQAA